MQMRVNISVTLHVRSREVHHRRVGERYSQSMIPLLKIHQQARMTKLRVEQSLEAVAYL